MPVYYNDNDAFCCQWVRNLIDKELIPPGKVDERDVRQVEAGQLKGYTRCHWFAGIAGWELALHLAGWPEDREVWTGSCPCQPFSTAGKRKGEADERHLWPAFRELIARDRPPVVIGEQVGSKLGREWFGGKPGLQRVQREMAKALIGPCPVINHLAAESDGPGGDQPEQHVALHVNERG